MYRSSRVKLIGLALIVLAFFVAVRSGQAESHPVFEAWNSAETAGAYAYTTRIEQRTIPLPKLENVGLKTITENIYIEGDVDRHAESMHMQIWSESGSALTGGGSLEMRVENGVAEGRSGGQPWQQVDDSSGFFAPGGDPLGYLNAAANLTDAGSESLMLPGQRNALNITKYSYDLDGEAFALFIRDQVEAEQLRKGELPTGIRVQASPDLIAMVGSGELWIDSASGLPIRQIIDIDMPNGEYDRVEATITTDFAQWNNSEVVNSEQWSVNSGLSSVVGGLSSLDMMAISANAAILFTSLLFTALLIKFGRNENAHRIFAIVMIYAMVGVPLLDARQAHAYSELNSERHESYEREQESRRNERLQAAGIATEAELLGKDDQLINSAINARTADETRDNILQIAYARLDLLEAQMLPDDADDEDGDGLSYNSELVAGTDPQNIDTDGDTLIDSLELYELDTDPTTADSDGDSIPDNIEVNGFVYNGTRFYTDPLLVDTNADGRIDGEECSWDGDTETLTCPDLDLDGTPDVLDYDDDGDGVEDELDVVPATVLGDLSTGLDDNQFTFGFDQMAQGKAAYVDIQVRPTDADHLWYSLNVLDWPTDDRQGNVRRVLDNTFFETYSAENRPRATPSSKLGDTRLLPMLELEMPWDASNPSRNLPVVDGAPAITQTMPLDQWLDVDEMRSFGVTVRMGADGTLSAYVPATLVRSRVTDQPIAFNARMLYRPIADWGSDHTARLVWLVQTIADSCEPPAGQNQQPYCADAANWQSNGTTIVHRYDEQFVLTGLKVTEQHGAEAAIVYQNPTWTTSQTGYDASSFNEDTLWSAAWGLEQQFVGSNMTVTVDSLTSSTFTDWDLPANSLGVAKHSFEHESELALLGTTYGKALLDAQFTASGLPHTTLLYLNETTTRIVDNSHTEQVTSTAGGIRIDMDSAEIAPYTRANMSWAPYRYSNGSWESFPIAEYWAALGDNLGSVLPNYFAEDGEQGVELIAQSYYLTLYQGIGAAVRYDGVAIAAPTIASSDMGNVLGYQSSLRLGWAIDNLAQTIRSVALFYDAAVINLPFKAALAFARLTGNYETAIVSNRTNNVISPYKTVPDTKMRLDRFELAAGRAFEAKVYPDSMRRLRTANDDFRFNALRSGQLEVSTDASRLGSSPSVRKSMTQLIKPSRQGLQAVGVVSAVFSVAQVATAFIDVFVDVPVEVELLISFIAVAISLVTLILWIPTVASFLLRFIDAGSGASQVTNQLRSTVTDTISKGKLGSFAVTAIIVGVISAGLFIAQIAYNGINVTSLAFTQALAGLIAGLIASAILIAIGAIPIVGQVIAAVLTLIDSIISAICLATDAANNASDFVQEWICPGISGLLTKAVQFLIYDQNPMVDLQNQNRLDLRMTGLAVADERLGYAKGNDMTIAFDVVPALYRPDVEPTVVGLVWLGQYLSDEFQRWARFDYKLATNETHVVAPVAFNTGPNLWRTPTANDKAADAAAVLSQPVPVSLTLTLPEAGVNETLPLYLQESYAIPVQECFGVTVVSACYVREDSDILNVPIGDSIYFDVFPETVADFMALAPRGDNTFALGWSSDFPELMDADGDGLLNKAVGGLDPNDSDPDSDDDTINDFREIELGMNPLLADSDGDTLLDADELRYGFDPLLADSDFDGLGDAIEARGWEVVYGFNGAGEPLTTRVYPEPTYGNVDYDAYSDAEEYALGLNPQKPNSDTLFDIGHEVSAAYVQANGQLALTTTLTNSLANREAHGILQTTLPALLTTGDATLENFVIAPESERVQALTLTSGNGGSQVVTVRTEASAVAEPVQGDALARTLHLPFSETSGSTFADASSAMQADAYCPNPNECPTTTAGVEDNGRYFGVDAVNLSGTANDYGINGGSYTFLTWFKELPLPIVSNAGTLLSDQVAGGLEIGYADGVVTVSGNGQSMQATLPSRYEWTRIALRYDANSNQHALFFDGTLVASSASINLDYSAVAERTLRLGETRSLVFLDTDPRLDVYLDEVEIYPDALDSDVVASEWQRQLFYYRFDRHLLERNIGGGNFSAETWTDDTAFNAPITCLSDGAFTPVKPLCAQPGDLTDGIVDSAHRFGRSGGEPSVLKVGETAQAGSYPQLDLSHGRFTISAWANVDDGVDGYLIGNNENSRYPELYVSNYNSSDEYLVNYGFGDVGPNGCHSSSLPTAVTFTSGNQTWHHYALTFDRDTLRLYVDGTQVHSMSCAGKRPPAVDGFYIGQNSSEINNDVFGSGALGGELDELRIFNYPLAAAQVSELAAIADNGVSVVGSAEISFDTAPGSVVLADSSFNDNDATCSNCPITGAQGLFGRAAHFDSANGNQELSVGSGQTLGIPDGFTVGAWVNLDETAGTRFVFHLLDGDLHLRITDGKPELYMDELTPAKELLTAPDALPTGRWQHLAYRYTVDRSSGDLLGHRSIFVNGVEVASDSFHPGTDTDASGTAWPLLGNQAAQIGHLFNGRIDELKLLGEPISAERIAAIVAERPDYYFPFELEDEVFGNFLYANEALSTEHGPITCNGTSCPTSQVSGRVGNGMLFDGIDDKLTTPVDYSELLENDAFTVGLWLKPTSVQLGGYTALFALEGATTPWLDRTFGLFFKPDSTDLFLSMEGCDGGASINEDVGYSLPLNLWAHVMLSYDRADSGSEVKVYINGVEQLSRAAAGDRCVPGGNSSEVVKVGPSFVGHRHFAGQVDELIIEPSAWSGQRILDLVQHQIGWLNAAVETPIVIDNDLPTATFGSSARLFPMGEQIISYLVSDPSSPVVDVQYLVASNHEGEIQGAMVQDGDVWLFSFNPPSPGDYRVYAFSVTDAAGNMVYVPGGATPITVDDSAPELTFDGNPSVRKSQRDEAADRFEIVLTGLVTATGSPLDSLRVNLIEGWNSVEMTNTGRSVNDWLPATVSGNVWQINYPIDILTTATYSVVVEAIDQLGNTNTVAIPSLMIDGTAPTAQIGAVFTSTAILTGTQLITGTVSDLASGVSLVEVSYQPTDYRRAGNSETPLISLGFDKFRFVGGEQLTDDSVYTQTAVLQAAGAFDSVPGIVRAAALPLDGTRSVSVAANASLDLSGGAYTQMAWVKTSAGSGTQFVIGDGSGAAAYPSLGVVDGTKITAGFGDGSGYSSFTTGDLLTVGKWHFVAVTFDGMTHKVFIDGVMRAVSMGLSSKMPAATAGFVIGNGFVGAVDQVEVYGVAISAETILEHHERRWRPATITNRNADAWLTTIPSTLEGSFQLQLQTTDSLDNTSFGLGDNASWNGYIVKADPTAVTGATTSAVSATPVAADLLGFFTSLIALTACAACAYVMKKRQKP